MVVVTYDVRWLVSIWKDDSGLRIVSLHLLFVWQLYNSSELCNTKKIRHEILCRINTGLWIAYENEKGYHVCEEDILKVIKFHY